MHNQHILCQPSLPLHKQEHTNEDKMYNAILD